MPAGTVFSKYVPHFFESLEIKEDTSGTNDYWSIELAGPIDSISMEDFAEKCEAMALRGESVPVNLTDYTRDGLYDAGQLFAVWERADVVSLISKLIASIP